jgi:peptide/nickel transport system permease protein
MRKQGFKSDYEKLAGAGPTGRSLVWKKFTRHRLAVVSLVLLTVIVFCCAAAPLISPYGRDQQHLENILAPPSAQHLFGTDKLGRDLFTRVLHGGRISLFVGFLAMLIAISVGVVLGALSGYFGGAADAAVMRFVDLMLSIPIFFLLLFMTLIFDRNLVLLCVLIGFTGWMYIARLVRSLFISLREKDFVEAARAIGAGRFKIIFLHILPNCMAPIIVAATLGIAQAILIETSLSYLEFGVQPPTPSWGNLLKHAVLSFRDCPWIAIIPGIMIFITVLSLNFIGDGLRDALDPRSHIES